MFRAAGTVFKQVPKLAKWLTANSTKGELALRLGMDGLMGAAIGMQQPGDLGDKLIAGATDATLGSLGGLALGRLGGKNQMARNMLDMAGSLGGAYAAFPVSEQLLRIKGGGMSPYDKLQLEQNAALRAQIEQDVLKQIMSGRPIPSVNTDQFLTDNGLG